MVAKYLPYRWCRRSCPTGRGGLGEPWRTMELQGKFRSDQKKMGGRKRRWRRGEYWEGREGGEGRSGRVVWRRKCVYVFFEGEAVSDIGAGTRGPTSDGSLLLGQLTPGRDGVSC
jgi:hypothetical protein